VSNFQMWALIVGFLMPPVQSIIQQTAWSDRVRALVNFAACAVAGAGVAYFQGDLTGRRFVEAGLVVFVAAIATYKGAWKPTGISPTIENATNVVGGGNA
jgi:hypothetical protein